MGDLWDCVFQKMKRFCNRIPEVNATVGQKCDKKITANSQTDDGKMRHGRTVVRSTERLQDVVDPFFNNTLCYNVSLVDMKVPSIIDVCCRRRCRRNVLSPEALTQVLKI